MVGGGHHHQADPSGVVPELVGGGEKAGFGEVALRFLAPLGVGGDDGAHLEIGVRGHQRCVEDLAGKPVPDQCDADAIHEKKSGTRPLPHAGR